MRLEVIERFGGVYIDTDFEALRAIDDLVAGLSPHLGSLVRLRLFLCVWSASPSFTRPFNTCDPHLAAGLDFFVGTEKNADTIVWGRPGEDREVWVCPSIFGAAPHNAAVRALLDGLPRQVPRPATPLPPSPILREIGASGDDFEGRFKTEAERRLPRAPPRCRFPRTWARTQTTSRGPTTGRACTI